MVETNLHLLDPYLTPVIKIIHETALVFQCKMMIKQYLIMPIIIKQKKWKLHFAITNAQNSLKYCQWFNVRGSREDFPIPDFNGKCFYLQFIKICSSYQNDLNSCPKLQSRTHCILPVWTEFKSKMSLAESVGFINSTWVTSRAGRSPRGFL